MQHSVAFLLILFTASVYGYQKNIVFSSTSDKGHLLPLLHIAEIIQQPKYNITFVSTCDARSLVESKGFNFECHGGGRPEDGLTGGMDKPHYIDMWRTAGFNFLPTSMDFYTFLTTYFAANKVDFVVVDFLTVGAMMAARDSGLPLVKNAPSYITNLVSDPLSFPASTFGRSAYMGIAQRVINAFNLIALRIGHYILHIGMMPVRGFSHWLSNSFIDELYAADPILCNYGYPFDYPRTMSPSYILTGPLLTLKSYSLIDLLGDREWYEEATEIIYISFGTTKASLKNSQLEAIHKSIAIICHEQRGTKFIWSMPSAETHTNNSCAKYVRWIHQRSVLADHKVTKFLNHGGLNGVMESLQNGKRSVIYPLFGDQPDVAIRAQDLRVGCILSKNFDSEELVLKLKEIDQKKYKEAALKTQKILLTTYNSTETINKLLTLFIDEGYSHLISYEEKLSFVEKYLEFIILVFLFGVYKLIKRM